MADGTFSKGARLLPLVKPAIEPTMRRGKLLSLTWESVDLKRQIAHLPDMKNRDPRTAPLSTRAVAILKALPLPEVVDEGSDTAEPERTGPVSPTTALALRKGFARAIERAQ